MKSWGREKNPKAEVLYFTSPPIPTTQNKSFMLT